MGAAALGARALVPGEPGVLSLALAVVVAVPVYLVAVRLLLPETFHEAWGLVRRRSLAPRPDEAT
jgi:hypothetical protein